MARKLLIFIPLILVGLASLGQIKSMQATKVDRAPKIDGNLDDAIWANIPVMTGFIQNFPTYGIPASLKTEVKIAYDNSAIYVGAYLYDDPSLIRRQITARDSEQQSDVDYFSIFFDTYNDHQNGFQFLVTSANVQTDSRLGPNLATGFGSYGDKSWDAVWESNVSTRPDGWVVEMRIPYISLRFSKKDIQSWGVQLLRSERRNNETSFWNPVDPTVSGFVNQFGILDGLKDLKPPLRLSLSPYISTGYRSTPQTDGYRSEWLRNGGMDVKYGINESFTLDATLIPDFGQVVSDNVINNLTPYEIKFQENRPFFTEGTELFNKSNLFYSRRVGSMPTGYNAIQDSALHDPNIEIIKNPALTQLYNAVKFSGRTKKKLGIGIFNAVTAPMHATIRDKTTGVVTRIQTEPLANYNIIVLDQAFRGQSYLTFTNTNVIRSGNGRDANVSGLDLALYDKENVHALTTTFRYSKVREATTYGGFNAGLQYGKVSGNWQYFLAANAVSARYDPNDLGILTAPNQVNYSGNLTYRQFQPNDHFITYSYGLNVKAQYLYDPYEYDNINVNPTVFLVFKNFWDITINGYLMPGWEHNYFELRTPNRFLNYPTNYAIDASGSTDSRKRWYLKYEFGYAISSKYRNTLYLGTLGLRYRFSNQFSLDLTNNSSIEYNQLGYAFRRELNNEPIVGFRDNSSIETILSGIYNFNSRLNLTLRTRHYWNKVVYSNFSDVDANGYLLPRGFIPGQNENFNVFNLDAFLTWDFRLGSSLVVGYKNWLGDDEVVNLTGKNSYLRNLSGVFGLRHGNEFTVRFIYFLDYSQFNKKRNKQMP